MTRKTVKVVEPAEVERKRGNLNRMGGVWSGMSNRACPDNAGRTCKNNPNKV